MRIYKIKNNSDNPFLNKFKKVKPRKKLIINFCLFVFIGGSLFIPIGLFRYNSKYINLLGQIISITSEKIDLQYGNLSRDVFSLGDNLFGMIYRYLGSFINRQDILEINLNAKNYKKIRDLRDLAIKDAILKRSENDKVKGFITYNGKKFPVRIRLKGDFVDHLLGEKWSFRLETKKDIAFLGMTEFSLQHPRTRSYISEYLLHKLLKYENLPYLRYKFLPVSLNGKYLGIYALEEHFSKELIENSGFREGPILKISDQDKRNEWNRKEFDKNKIIGKKVIKGYINTTENNSQILTFNIDKIAQNEKKLSQFQLGSDLLNEFLMKKIKTSEVFDIHTTARYFAVLDLLQALGAYTWYDMRFYFDPLTGRLTPIGYDAQTGYILKKRYLSLDINALGLFDDPIFIKEYLSQLDRISSDNYLEKFLNLVSSDLNKELSIINKSFPFVNLRLFKDEILKNRIYIKNRLFRLNPLGLKSLQISQDNEQLYLEIFNKNKLPIILESVIYGGIKFIPDKNNYLPGQTPFKRITINKIKFIKGNDPFNKNNITKENNFLKSNLLKDISLKFFVDGIPEIRTLKTKVFQKVNSTNTFDPQITRKTTLKQFKDLNIDFDKKEILINQDITVNKLLILPIEYKLIISPGVNLIIDKGGSIIIQGPLIINGEESKKIYIKSINGGKGLSVLNASSLSNIKYAVFDNLRVNTNPSMNITGGISFYNSQVQINNSQFINSSSEDSLNLIRSPFKIKNSVFSDNNFDAIDIDFSNGKIVNTIFKNTGNDAVDISGSQVDLNQISIISAGDKGVSVGEKSKVNLANLTISDAFIGIASKDYSQTIIDNLKISDSKICLAAYQKKPEYGPGFIKLQESNYSCETEYILENGSSIKSSVYNFLPNTVNAYKKLYKE